MLFESNLHEVIQKSVSMHKETVERKLEPEERPYEIQINWNVEEDGMFIFRKINETWTEEVRLTIAGIV